GRCLEPRGSGRGCRQREAARKLGTSPRSLRRWTKHNANWVPRGRRVQRSPLAVRQQIIAQLAEWGPHTSVAALKQAFPNVMRAELEDLLALPPHSPAPAAQTADPAAMAAARRCLGRRLRLPASAD